MNDARPARARPRILVLGIAALALAPATARAGDVGVPTGPAATGAEVTAEDLRSRVRYLASDELGGRMSTEPGGLLASAYVAKEFQRIGLKPLGDGGDWFQGFEIAQVKLQEGNRLEAETCEVGAMGDVGVGADGEVEKRTFAIEKDWNPFSVSPNAEAQGPLLFAGYGITNPDKGYDDFAGVDVKGKVLLVFRKEPVIEARRASRHATFLAKLAQAATREAAALLLVNDERTAADGDRIFHWSVPIGPPAGSAKIPFAFVTRETAAALLAPLLASRPEGERNLAGLQAAIDKAPGGPKPASAVVPGVRVRIQAALKRASGKNARNVVGLLPGADPKLADEVVVVGAHHDHVGSGWFASAGGSAAAGKIHPGADDNASGTAALLEIAENLAAAKERPRRPVLFLSFSGEELGLLGSAHYVDHPVLPLDRVVTMVNCDMVGAYDAERKLEIGGVGTAAGLQDLVETANRPYGLNLAWDPQGVAPSDNTSFFRKKVPVLFFFTGVHDRYHTPADTWDKLNYADGEKVARLCRDVVVRLCDADARVAFTKPPPRPGENRAILGIGLGEPSDAPGGTVGEGAEGGPAAEAGLEPGDVITSIDLASTRTPQDLLRVLASHAPGDSIRVTVLRGDATKVLTVRLGSR